MRSCDNFRELISAMTDGELSGDEMAELRAHISSCEECKLVFDAFAGISNAISESISEPPPELVIGAMLKIRATKASSKRPVRPAIRYAAMAACAALVIIGATQMDFNGGGSSSAPTLSGGASDDATAKIYGIEAAPEVPAGGMFDAGGESLADAPMDAPEAATAQEPEAFSGGTSNQGTDADMFYAAGDPPLYTVADDAPEPDPEPEPERQAPPPEEVPVDSALAPFIPEDSIPLMPEEPPGTFIEPEGDEGELFGQIVSAQIRSATTQDIILDTADTETLKSLVALLMACESIDFEPSVQTSYTVYMTYESGGFDRIDLWVENGDLIRSEGDGYVLASGTEAELKDFFAAL